MIIKTVPMPMAQYEQLKLLGDTLGIDVDDLLELRNVKNCICELKEIKERYDKVLENQKVIENKLIEIATFLNSKQDDYFGELYEELMKNFGGINNG